MVLFIFFALPVATILLAIVLQKILRCPILVAITFFAIYLIASFAFFSGSLAEALIATIIYTIIAFITAYIVRLICNLIERFGTQQTSCGCGCNNNDNDNSSNDLLRINYSCGNGESSNLLTVSRDCGGNNNNDDNNNGCDCSCNNATINSGGSVFGNQGRNVAINANFIPCQNNNGRTGFVRGCYRRR